MKIVNFIFKFIASFAIVGIITFTILNIIM